MFCEKIYTLFDLFRRLRETFAALRQNVIGRVVKTELYVIKGMLSRKKSFFEGLLRFLRFFQNIDLQNLGQLAKTFRRGGKKCILHVEMNIWGFEKLGKTFWTNDSDSFIIFVTRAKIFRPPRQFFWQGCQNFVLRDHRNILSRNIRLKKVHSFIISRFWTKSAF